MMELPRALTPWASQLEIFPPDLALSLGQLAARLSNALGPWPRPNQQAGEPDGYDGVARRGSYQRLLPAEWLLLDELPDEFLRRVVSHEHAFLSPAFRQHAGGRHCLAVLDSGPEQLGAPRIAQLALLVALAARAAASRATFAWATLRPGPLLWHDELSKVSVLELVASRNARPLALPELEERLREAEALACAAGATHELWLLGGETLATLGAARHSRTITVTELLEAGAPQRVQVDVADERRGWRRAVQLELPAERLAVQLLRDPFAIRTAPRIASGVPLGLGAALGFSGDDRRLYCRAADHSLLTLHVPNSTHSTERGPAPCTFRPPSGLRMIAVGTGGGKRTTVLCQEGDELVALLLSRRGAIATDQRRFRCEDDGSTPVLVEDALRPLSVQSEDRVLFADDQGELYDLHRGTFRLADRGVLDLQASVSKLCWLTYRDDTLRWCYLSSMREDQPLHPAKQQVMWRGQVTRALTALSSLPLVARCTEGRWTLTCEGRLDVTPVVPPGATVHGILTGYDTDPCLLVLDAQRRRLLAIGSDAPVVLCTSMAPITSATVNHRGSVIAYLTETGDTALYSYAARQFVLRATQSAEGPGARAGGLGGVEGVEGVEGAEGAEGTGSTGGTAA